MNYNSFNPITALTNPFSLDALFCNTIENTDSYKKGHFTFEEEGVTNDYAYIEARNGGDFKEVVFFGPQYFILYYLTKPITMEMIDEAEINTIAHGLPFHREGWELILNRYNGYMPVRIKALREGLIVPHGVVQMTIESTDPEITWAARYVETALLRSVWFGSTVAARMARWKKKLLPYLERTGTPETIDFKMVDFGARGSETTESAAVAGAAVLINTQVTDNQIAMRLVKKAYPGSAANTPEGVFMPAFSISATEHSVTTAWGRDQELEFYRNIINTYGKMPRLPDGSRRPVSVVIDTYDQDEAVRMWLVDLHDELKNSNMKVILRPDSGDPVVNIPHLCDLITSYVGYKTNNKGFRIFPDYVGLIQGDSVDEDSLIKIADAVEAAGYSLDVLNFGSGGGLLQKDVTRDTHRYAQKASEVVVNGETRAICKMPKTDPSKASKAGRFSVVRRNGILTTVTENQFYPNEKDELELVFENGKVMRILSFADVRNNFAEALSYVE
jgi:nicotinamide phosphoribosyltransferase